MLYLKQSTAATIVLGPFVDSTDGVTAETALTISQADVRLSKNGGAFAQANEATSASHMENGYYSKALNTTDTNTLGVLLVAVSESGALPVWREFTVLAANVYDSLIGGGDVLDVSTTQFNGSAVVQSGGRPEVNLTHISGSAVSTTTAQLGVNVVQVSGDATAADNLEAAADGTGYNLGGGSIVAASVTGNVGGNVTGSVGSVATDGITSGSLAATAITEIQSGLSTLTAAGVRTAVGLASANLDTQLGAIDDFLDTEVAAIKAKTDQLTFGAANTVNANITHVIADPVQTNGSTTTNWGGTP